MEPTAFLSTPDAAKYLSSDSIPLSPKTLEKWRVTGGGPAFHRFGGEKRGRVMYKKADLDSWANARRRTSTSDQGLAA